jgi:hypothetical protein
MKREIKGQIFQIREVYKTTLWIECSSQYDFVKFLLTIRERGYIKPQLYFLRMDSGSQTRISYNYLYEWTKEYYPELYKPLKRIFL